MRTLRGCGGQRESARAGGCRAGELRAAHAALVLGGGELEEWEGEKAVVLGLGAA